MARTGMGNSQSQPQLSFLNLSNYNSPTPMPHSDQRHILIAERLRDVIFSAKYVNHGGDTDNHPLPFTAEKIKSEIERRLHQFLPSFHTPTHLPYASMIQRAIVELGEGQGLSEESISDFIKKEYEDLPWAHTALLSRHLGKLCESGELVKSKCGFYKFKTEYGGVKRKKRRGKTTGRSRQRGVQCTDEIENEEFDGKRESQNQVIVGLPAPEELTIKGTKELSASLRREIEGAGVGDPSQGGQIGVLDNFKEHSNIDECLKEEVKSRDGIGIFYGKKKSLSRTNTLRLCANEAQTIQETTVHGRQIEVLDKLEMAGENKMVVTYCEEEGQGEVVEEPMERAAKGSNGEEGPSEETTSVFFDTHSNLSDEEENGSIDALCFKKLQEGNRHVELFDSISDHDDNEVSEMIDAQSSKENARCKVSDEQNKLQEELLFKVNDDRSPLDNTDDPQLFKEQPQHIGPFEINMTSETSVAGSLPLEHQIKTPRHAEQGKTCTPESGKHANAKLDIISSPKVQPSKRRGRGRPRKLNIHGTLAVPSSSSPQDCNHQCLEMNSEVNEASKVETGDDTHYLDQQQHQISMSETVSPPKDPDHQQSLDKRDSGMPLKRKFDADLSLRDVLTSKNEQQEPKRRGRGRPRKVTCCGRGRPRKVL